MQCTFRGIRFQNSLYNGLGNQYGMLSLAVDCRLAVIGLAVLMVGKQPLNVSLGYKGIINVLNNHLMIPPELFQTKLDAVQPAKFRVWVDRNRGMPFQSVYPFLVIDLRKASIKHQDDWPTPCFIILVCQPLSEILFSVKRQEQLGKTHTGRIPPR